MSEYSTQKTHKRRKEVEILDYSREYYDMDGYLYFFDKMMVS